MTASWLSSLHPMTLPDHCTPTSPFLHSVSSLLNTCVPTPLAFISTLLGTLSIISWLFAQLPQIYKNYALQSTAGLSVFFLLEWCLGDSANLAGAILTKQAGWQVTVASYYVFVDVVLVSQFFWYARAGNIYRGRDSFSSTNPSINDDNASIDGISVSEAGSANGNGVHHSAPITRSNPSGGYSWTGGKDGEAGSSAPKPSHSGPGSFSNEKRFSRPEYNKGRTRGLTKSSMLGVSPNTVVLVSMLCAVLARASPIDQPVSSAAGYPIFLTTSATASSTSESSTTREVAGSIISWLSTLLYLGSRLPQLYKNHCRKSTAGLSPLLFFAAFCGNLFYSSSLLTNPNAWSDFGPHGGNGWADASGNDRLEWIALAAPFWLGAAGVLALDGAMGVQFWKYGEARQKDVEVRVHVVDGRGRDTWRWRRVSGWMRGWVPSGGREVSSREVEGQRLLGGSEERRDGGYGTV